MRPAPLCSIEQLALGKIVRESATDLLNVGAERLVIELALDHVGGGQSVPERFENPRRRERIECTRGISDREPTFSRDAVENIAVRGMHMECDRPAIDSNRRPNMPGACQRLRPPPFGV